jgi:hypothetical protein
MLLFIFAFIYLIPGIPALSTIRPNISSGPNFQERSSAIKFLGGFRRESVFPNKIKFFDYSYCFFLTKYVKHL